MTTIGPNNPNNPQINSTNPDGGKSQSGGSGDTGSDNATTHVPESIADGQQKLTAAMDALAALNKTNVGNPPFNTDMQAFLQKFPPSVADHVQTVLTQDFPNLSPGAQTAVAEAVLSKLAGLS